MAGGLVSLLDDVATLARLAAASLDDVGAAAGRAGTKAAGVLVDDAAVTPRYVHDFTADRELPMIRRIATGSLRNKMLFILPAALFLSVFLPWLLTPLLMLGGTYLSYEGTEKIWEKLSGHSGDHGHAAPHAAEDEDEMVSGAIRTDFILSSEIMVIALNEVANEDLPIRAATLFVVAIGITILIYGVVAVIVKVDDVGLFMAEQESNLSQTIGAALVKGMPKFLKLLAVVGVAAMLWVGGHILLVGFDELGWHWPYDQVHHLEESVADTMSSIGGLAGWLTNTLASAVIGIVAGAIVVAVMHVIPRRGAAH
jgi:predicted DNA repair protein MutK